MASKLDSRWRSAAALAGRALLYAVAVVILVLAAPGAEHVFIYQGF